jgi:hypothetical protein
MGYEVIRSGDDAWMQAYPDLVPHVAFAQYK